MARPFKELRDRMSPEARARVDRRVRETLLEMSLKEIRRDVSGVTQTELADLMKVTQGAISQLEKRQDALLSNLAGYDLSTAYLDALDELCTSASPLPVPTTRPQHPADLALEIAREYGCHDPHRAKPGIGEATRVFLRRRPAALVVRARTPDTAHLETLAHATHVPVHTEPALPYAAMSLIAGPDASPGDARDL